MSDQTRCYLCEYKQNRIERLQDEIERLRVALKMVLNNIDIAPSRIVGGAHGQIVGCEVIEYRVRLGGFQLSEWQEIAQASGEVSK